MAVDNIVVNSCTAHGEVVVKNGRVVILRREVLHLVSPTSAGESLHSDIILLRPMGG